MSTWHERRQEPRIKAEKTPGPSRQKKARSLSSSAQIHVEKPSKRVRLPLRTPLATLDKESTGACDGASNKPKRDYASEREKSVPKAQSLKDGF